MLGNNFDIKECNVNKRRQKYGEYEEMEGSRE
jgi:hypothetical protein